MGLRVRHVRLCACAPKPYAWRPPAELPAKCVLSTPCCLALARARRHRSRRPPDRAKGEPPPPKRWHRSRSAHLGGGATARVAPGGLRGNREVAIASTHRLPDFIRTVVTCAKAERERADTTAPQTPRGPGRDVHVGIVRLKIIALEHVHNGNACSNTSAAQLLRAGHMRACMRYVRGSGRWLPVCTDTGIPAGRLVIPAGGRQPGHTT